MPQIRIAAGFTNLRKDNGDYLSNLRAVIRRTSKDKKYQLELFADKGIDNKGIPKGHTIGFFVRYNR